MTPAKASRPRAGKSALRGRRSARLPSKDKDGFRKSPRVQARPIMAGAMRK
jgi:hypothetical protein